MAAIRWNFCFIAFNRNSELEMDNRRMATPILSWFCFFDRNWSIFFLDLIEKFRYFPSSLLLYVCPFTICFMCYCDQFGDSVRFSRNNNNPRSVVFLSLRLYSSVLLSIKHQSNAIIFINRLLFLHGAVNGGVYVCARAEKKENDRQPQKGIIITHIHTIIIKPNYINLVKRKNIKFL